jgi:hypothetical protein
MGTLKVITMGTLVWTPPWLGAGETAVIWGGGSGPQPPSRATNAPPAATAASRR